MFLCVAVTQRCVEFEHPVQSALNELAVPAVGTRNAKSFCHAFYGYAFY